MSSADDLFTWAILGLLFLGVAALYSWLFWVKTRAFLAAMIRLRDRIDRSERH